MKKYFKKHLDNIHYVQYICLTIQTSIKITNQLTNFKYNLHMKTNSKEFNALMYPYILGAISNEGYNMPELTTDKEKLEFLAKEFKSQYCFPDNLKRYGSYQEILKQWIMGLPSVFNIDYENYRIIEIAEKWGSLPKNSSDDQQWKIINNWFNLIAFKTIQLMEKHGINFYNS